MRPIVITAGHSNADPGAVANDTTEAIIVTEFRNLVAAQLRELGANPITDGSGPHNLPLADAIRLIQPGSLAVEFHCNAGPRTATGVETLSRPGEQAFGGRLCAAISAVLGIPSRGAKGESAGQHVRLGFVRAGGVICELFFLTNPTDLLLYQANKEALAIAVADVLIAEAQ